MAAELSINSYDWGEDRTIVFDGEIHPYHILQSNLHTIKSDFVWYLRDSIHTGLVYVDFLSCEKMTGAGKLISTWKYYSIPFGLAKKGWNRVDPSNAKQIEQLIQLGTDNVVQHMQDLLTKLEKLNIATLNMQPEIERLMEYVKEAHSDLNPGIAINNNSNKRLVAGLRLDPTYKHASKINKVFQVCTQTNLIKEALRKEIQDRSRKNILLRCLEWVNRKFFLLKTL